MSDIDTSAIRREAWVNAVPMPNAMKIYALCDEVDRLRASAESSLAAAYKALTPLRELHKPYSPLWPEDVTDCDHCETPWPCDTAKLIYSTEELS